MKNLFLSILLLTITVCGCTKKDASTDTTMTASDVKPTADFSITNMTSWDNTNYVTEGKNLKFNVTARNALHYAWDFGNGIKYEGKTPPHDIYYVPCGGTYTITLTTTNLYGTTSTLAKSFYVLCSGKNTHGQHMPD